MILFFPGPARSTHALSSQRLSVNISLGEKMKSLLMDRPQESVEQLDATARNPSFSPVLSEKEVIHKAQQGDASAFEHLYHLHSSRIYALCLRMVGNIAEAEDLTQETFLMLFRKIRTFRGESAFSTWLHRIAVNVVLMRLRRKSWLETSLDDNNPPAGDRDGVSAEPTDFDHVLNGSLDRLNLERAMKQLSPFQKLVVVLHDIQGYKHTEIARMMDWSIGNSKSRLHRARARLREILQESLGLNSISPSLAAQAASGA
jgi:RNA polymerase sigma-70 factor (ECF subfamily)